MTLNVGLLGFGYVGKVFHAPLIAATAGLRLAAVGSSDPARVRADWPDVHVGPVADVVVHPDVDLVVVATPNDTHHPLARRALEAGKHVVIDKPFTVTRAEAVDLARLAAERKRVLSAFHNLRWNADFLTLRALVAQGRLGEVRYFESHFDRHRPEVRARWREQAGPGSGIWYDLGSHLLDQALQLFGAPRAVFADLALQRDGAQAVDYFHVLLRYERTRVILHGSNLVAGGSPRYVVHGDQASYVKHGLDPQEEALRRGERPGAPGWGRDPQDGTLYRPAETGAAPEPVPTQPGDWRAYYAQLVEAVAGRGPNPVPATDAIRVMALLELAMQSAAAACERPVDPALFDLTH
jgi:predicted dehydrogenase